MDSPRSSGSRRNSLSDDFRVSIDNTQQNTAIEKHYSFSYPNRYDLGCRLVSYLGSAGVFESALTLATPAAIERLYGLAVPNAEDPSSAFVGAVVVLPIGVVVCGMSTVVQYLRARQFVPQISAVKQIDVDSVPVSTEGSPLKPDLDRTPPGRRILMTMGKKQFLPMLLGAFTGAAVYGFMLPILLNASGIDLSKVGFKSLVWSIALGVLIASFGLFVLSLFFPRTEIMPVEHPNDTDSFSDAGGFRTEKGGAFERKGIKEKYDAAAHAKMQLNPNREGVVRVVQPGEK